jgi:hypothetical protein
MSDHREQFNRPIRLLLLKGLDIETFSAQPKRTPASRPKKSILLVNFRKSLAANDPERNPHW